VDGWGREIKMMGKDDEGGDWERSLHALDEKQPEQIDEEASYTRSSLVSSSTTSIASSGERMRKLRAGETNRSEKKER
jgi:hypothetical protein